MAEQKQESESPSFTITYFGIGGRAAPLRMAAFLGGLSYCDRFLSGKQHGMQKAQGKRRWSGIPELTLHDKDGNDVATIGQSNVCLTLIGKMGGLYPEDNVVQQALIDEILAAVEDVMGLLAPSFPVKDPEKKKAMRLAMMEAGKLPYWFQKFENRLTENEARGRKNGFVVGDTMTIADLKLYSQLSFLCSGKVDHIDGATLLKPVAKLSAYLEMMAANEEIKKFNAAFEKQQAEVKAKTEKDENDNEFLVKGKNVYSSL